MGCTFASNPVIVLANQWVGGGGEGGGCVTLAAREIFLRACRGSASCPTVTLGWAAGVGLVLVRCCASMSVVLPSARPFLRIGADTCLPACPPFACVPGYHRTAGIFIIHLRGEQELRDLQAFIADPSFGSDDDDDALDGSAYADDDDDMSLMWKLTELEIRGDYEDLQRRTRRAQQLRAIKEKFEQMQQEQQEQQQQQQREQQQQQLDEQTQQHLEQQALLQQHTTRLRGAGVNALSSSTGYGLGTLRPQESGYGSDSADPCFSSWEDPPDLSYSSSSRSWSLTTFSSFVRDFFSSTTGDEEGEGEQGDGGGSAEAGKPAAVRGPAAAWIAKRQEQHQEQREAAAAATTGEANRGQQQLPRGVATVWSRWSFFGSLFGSFEEFGALVAGEH